MRKRDPPGHRAVLPLTCSFGWAALWALLVWTAAPGRAAPATGTPEECRALVLRMEAAYAAVGDYQTRLTISGFGSDHAFRTTHRVRYAFKKPDRVRIDFEFPHEGMTIVYPDEKGRVALRPWRGLSSLVLHLKPENPLVEISPGQRINQTDLGMLIQNISLSLGRLYLGDLKMEEDGDHLVLRVLSENPFARGIRTRFTFTIDTRLWLPVAVEESTDSGVLKRRVVYEDMRINTGLTDAFFWLG